MKSIIAAGLMAALAIAPLASAEADVIYNFTGTRTVLGQDSALSLQLVLTTEGTSFNLDGGPGPGPIPPGTPFRGDVDRFVSLRIDMESVTPSYIRGVLDLALSFDSAGSVTSTQLDYRGDYTSLLLSGQGQTAQGYIGIDQSPCQVNAQSCAVNGTWTKVQATAVPEPMSIALFGAGLAGLAMVRRRKA